MKNTQVLTALPTTLVSGVSCPNAMFFSAIACNPGCWQPNRPHGFFRSCPRYFHRLSYTGGFTREAIIGLQATPDTDYLGWSVAMAPVIHQ